MAITGEKGFAFSIDLALAFFAVLLISTLMLGHLNLAKEKQVSGLERLSLERKALFLADSIVKKRNDENPALGSALFDWEKHRVLSNHLDSGLFSKAMPLQGEDFFLAGLSCTIDGEEKVLWDLPGKNCVSIDRIVLVEGKIGSVRVKVCEN